MGTNGIDAQVIENQINETIVYSIIIVSGGDDQSLSLYKGVITFSNEKLLSLSNHFIHTIMDASGSAIKNIKLIDNNIMTVGYDQRLNIWKINYNNVFIHKTIETNEFNEIQNVNIMQTKFMRKESKIIAWFDATIVNTGDVNGMDALVMKTSENKELVDIVVVGEGFQTFSMKLNET